MARPIKRGFSYFPFDTDLLGNRKIRRLLDKFGCEGTMVYFSILCEIYSKEGYFVPFGRNLCFDVGYLLHLSEAHVKEIVSFCVKTELFDAEMLKKQQVISSKGIQKRYLEVSKRLRRKGDTELMNFEPTSVIEEKKTVSVEETTVRVEKKPVVDNNKYTKGKGKGKGKENKEKNKKEISGVINLKKRKIYDTQHQQPSATDEDAKRQAELDRMREAATTNQ